MKTLFIRIFALLGFFLAASNSLAANDFYFSFVCSTTPQGSCNGGSFNPKQEYGFYGICTKAGSQLYVSKNNKACDSYIPPTPTPTLTPTPTPPTPTPTPTPPSCEQTIGNAPGGSCTSSSCTVSISNPEQGLVLGNKRFCSGQCEYKGEVVSQWSTVTAWNPDGTPATCAIGGCKEYYKLVGTKGTGQSCVNGNPPSSSTGTIKDPTPVPTPPPPGRCPGEFNGQTIWVDCEDFKTGSSSTTTTSDSSGSTTQTSQTTCTRDECTTTTTTTSTPTGGASSSSTTTTTTSKLTFCQENPQSTACVSTSDDGFCEQNPQLSVCKDGKWGAGSCGSEPSCSGDEVQCAQARFAFKSYCESKKTSDLLQDLGEKFSADSDGGAGMPSAISFYTPSYPDGIAGVWASKKDQFNQTPLATLGARLLPDVGEGGQNPSFTFDLDFGGVMNLGTHTLEIDPNIWAIIRAIVLVSAMIYAYKMIFGG